VRDQQAASAAVVGGAADADFGNWGMVIGTAHIPSVGDMSLKG
jgi:hypothetical protein